MSKFSVLTATVADASARMTTIAPGVREIHGRLGQHTGAAAGTPAGGAVRELMGHWSSVLPEFALAAEQLSEAMAAAAQAYHESDAAIGAAAIGEEGKR